MSQQGVSRAIWLASSELRAWKISALTLSDGTSRTSATSRVPQGAELRQEQGGPLVLRQAGDVAQQLA